MPDSFYAILSEDSDWAKLSRSETARHKLAMCTSCNAIRPEWWPRPFDVQLRAAPDEDGPILGIFRCLACVVRIDLCSLLDPFLAGFTQGQVFVDGQDTALRNWTTLLTPRRNWAAVHLGAGAKFAKCPTCGHVQETTSPPPYYFVRKEVQDRSVFTTGEGLYVSGAVRDILDRAGVPGIEFEQIQLLDTPLDEQPPIAP